MGGADPALVAQKKTVAKPGAAVDMVQSSAEDVEVCRCESEEYDRVSASVVSESDNEEVGMLEEQQGMGSSLPNVVVAVSYTHLTLPTKRIV